MHHDHHEGGREGGKEGRREGGVFLAKTEQSSGLVCSRVKSAMAPFLLLSVQLVEADVRCVTQNEGGAA